MVAGLVCPRCLWPELRRLATRPQLTVSAGGPGGGAWEHTSRGTRRTKRGRDSSARPWSRRLFYGVFSAWVLWARQDARHRAGEFNWHEAVWHLRVRQCWRALVLSSLPIPSRLQPLGLRRSAGLGCGGARPGRPGSVFRQIQRRRGRCPTSTNRFWTPLIPELRKQLGVWYTPVEVVRYMVARVDKALKDDLGYPGRPWLRRTCMSWTRAAVLARIWRKCCAVSRPISTAGAWVRSLAHGSNRRRLDRVFGFEIMPAPFVVAHLQVGLTMQSLAAPLADDKNERPGIFFTNALTGWEPTDKEKQVVGFPELEQERGPGQSGEARPAYSRHSRQPAL